MANTSTYKGLYAMHKYWGKKPFNEISKFIEKYSDNEDAVMDCFCGSGVTLIEAVKMGRKAVGIDLNPIAIKLTKASLTPVDISEVKSEFARIKKAVFSQIDSLYKVTLDGEETTVTHTIWKNNEPIEVWYSTKTVRKIIREGLQIDKELANKPKIKAKWFPTSKMFENSRINVAREQKVSDLFTPRALVGLSLILDEIKKIKDEKIRNLFELTLTGTLSQASNLVFVIRGRKKNEGIRDKAEVGSWVIGYWVPEEHFEIHAWNCFENRFKRIVKGEEEINELFFDKSNDYMKSHINLINGSATEIPLEDDSIDYVFIDPPHANRILYMEQSLMWNSWLELDKNIEWGKEIIVSEAKDRKDKNTDNYNLLLDKAFGEIQRVLKPNRFFSMAFNCLDNETWIETLNLFIKHGFEIKEIVPLEYSATSVIQDNRKNALKTDFVLTFQNTGESGQRSIQFQVDETDLKEKITEIVNQHPEYEVYNVMNYLFEKTIPDGYIYKVSHIVKICAEVVK